MLDLFASVAARQARSRNLLERQHRSFDPRVRLAPILSTVAFAAACGSSNAHGEATWMDAGGPPPGYVRFTSAPVSVAAGVSNQWIEWVQAPLDHDVDVVDIQGTQSRGGHHAVLYATSDVQPVGTVQPWKDSDIVSAHFLGGIGGEGAAALKLPEGAVFRLPAGQALALQIHYLNAGAEALQGTTQLDVKFGAPSTSDHLASMLTNTALSFQVPAQSKLHVDVTCKLGQDIPLVMMTNHLHQWGVSAQTVLTDPSGEQTLLKSDPVWNHEWTTNPDFAKFTVASPLVLTAGSTLTTSCDWSNTTNQTLAFPAEMCVFIGFYLGNGDVGCVNSGAFTGL